MLQATERQPTVRRLTGLPEAEAFRVLVEAWRALGAWLSVWTPDGEPVDLDTSGPKLWSTLWKSDGSLRHALGAAAREATANSNDSGFGVRIVDRAGECPDAALIVIPIQRRSRLVGTCLAMVLLDGPVDEDAWRRYCDARRFDFKAILEMARRVPRRSASELGALGGILATTLAQSADVAGKQAEIDDLVRNLDYAYEEINLQYRLSGELSLSEETEPVLKRVAREFLAICRARAVVFQVLDRGRNGAEQSAEERRLTFVGCDLIPEDQLEQLAAQISGETHHESKIVIFNDACNRAEFAWAAGWLRHVVALPMQYRQRPLGLMLAINCVDDGDFTSVEIQLLRSVADRVGAFLHKQRLYDDLSELLLGLLDSLINSIDAKDPYTCGHSERVAFLSRRLAEAVGLGPVESQRVYLAGLLHDVGKIGVPDAILLKPGRLTAEEYEVLKQHPEIGARILSKVPQVQDLLPGVLHHHERMDGRGYPHRLAGSRIPRLARILCLADSLDAMTTTRTYRSFLPPRVAMAEVRRCAGTQFDPQLAEALLAMDVPKLLAEAHEFAGSVLPRLDADGAAVHAVSEIRFASRPIFTRDMFAAQVTQW